MSLSPGTRFGSYEIVGPLGAGGMGEVYRARDTELGREVAIKVLPPAVAQDADRLIRFRREAQLLAALNHTNIGSIYGLYEADGIRGLVLELVEGETLAAMIASAGRGLPVGTAVSIARQIANALDAAHQKGIIHRDLKPANLKITPAGLVKVLDFGLGKALEDDAVNEDSLAETAGLSRRVSMPGMVLGTVAYMSPEQVRGEALDSRSDLFSLGIVLYEMTTGRAPFDGSVTPVIFDAILHKKVPPPSRINSVVPPALDRIILKLLEKEKDARFASAAELSVALGQFESGVGSAVAKPTRRVWAVLAAVMLLAVSGLAFWQLRKETLPTPSQYVQVTNVADSATSPSLSPDGRMLTFLRGPFTFWGPGQIYVKTLPDGEPVQLTNDALDKMSPVFSPDGTRVAYTTVDQKFGWNTWVVSVVGREPRLWLNNASGLSWTAPGRVLFSEMTGKGLQMGVVAAAESRAGSRTVYRPVDDQGMAHRSALSPDGRSVLLVEMESNVFGRCRVVPVDGGSIGRRVGPDGPCTSGAWSPNGRWMYFSSRVNGAFHIWRQRSPDAAPEQLTSGPSQEEGLAVAPDGRSLLTSLGTSQSAIWIHDARGDREISGEGFAFIPRGAPTLSQPFAADGSKLFFLVRESSQVTDQDLSAGTFWATDLESGRREALFPGFNVISYDVSRDGKRIVFAARDAQHRPHLWLARLDGQLTPRQISPVEADSPRFGMNGDIFFRMQEGSSRFIFQTGEDGGEIQKALAEPITFFESISPDGAFLIARVNAPLQPGQKTGDALVVAFPTKGGRAIPLCGDCEVDWAPGGEALAVRAFTPTQSLMFTLAPGETLPRLPAKGILSEADAAGLDHVVVADGYRFPGRDGSQYAYIKMAIQRNIYRVPLP